MFPTDFIKHVGAQELVAPAAVSHLEKVLGQPLRRKSAHVRKADVNYEIIVVVIEGSHIRGLALRVVAGHVIRAIIISYHSLAVRSATL